MELIDYIIIALAAAAVVSLIVHKVREIRGKGCSGCCSDYSECKKGCKKHDGKL